MPGRRSVVSLTLALSPFFLDVVTLSASRWPGCSRSCTAGAFALTIVCIVVPESEAEAAVCSPLSGTPSREASTMAASGLLPADQHAVRICLGAVALPGLVQGA